MEDRRQSFPFPPLVFEDCVSSPCNGHNCTSVQDSFICTCDGGWSGTKCTTPPDKCNGNACENGATCNSGTTNYSCSCATGYSGSFCEISPLDGGWSEWAVSECSKSCGTGSLTRTRQCNSPVPDTHGADCVGDVTETIACNTDACPVCEQLMSASGSLFNCSTNGTFGDETGTVYCEDG
ncbi:thrombospondin-1-like [Ruditapes philippinarum]|uniref:thrombospondin-1-like n=1 Tax=Ruditapes philippinarum TaxID=129788 RepID=UPI00295ADAEE|nr:thrombospondin-1-like [Ruditapes philippinarum]